MKTISELNKEELGFDFIKAYPILNGLKASPLEISIIELVLSYQENGQDFYMNYDQIAKILKAKKQSIKNSVGKLNKKGYIETINSKNYNGRNGGSSTTITVNELFIINELTATPTKEDISDIQPVLETIEDTTENIQEAKQAATEDMDDDFWSSIQADMNREHTGKATDFLFKNDKKDKTTTKITPKKPVVNKKLRYNQKMIEQLLNKYNVVEDREDYMALVTENCDIQQVSEFITNNLK